MDGMTLILIAVILIGVITLAAARKSSGATNTGGTSSAAKPTGGTTTAQMVQDIKLTKTSRVVDEVSIVDELGVHTPGFRQYCELVGTSGSDAGLIAPYSKRQVAYYDIRCFRVERVGGQITETLVAHERSIDPFYFTDGTTDEKVYVDLDTFGNDVILVNSTNHIEGPNSDFSKAMGTGANAATGSATRGTASAMVARAQERLNNLLDGARSLLAPLPTLAFAYAGASGMPSAGEAQGGPRSNLLQAAGRPAGPGAPNAGRQPASRGGSSRQPHPQQPRPSRPHRPGTPSGYGMPPMTSGLGDFLGGSQRPSMPYTHRRTSADEELIGAMIGAGLGALLGSLNNTSAQTAAEQNSSFQGYRLVEDVVPLGGPVYCIGEIYRNGTQVHMGRSLAEDYPTSFFACKPEAEVLSSLSAQ